MLLWFTFEILFCRTCVGVLCLQTTNTMQYDKFDGFSTVSHEICMNNKSYFCYFICVILYHFCIQVRSLSCLGLTLSVPLNLQLSC